ncbi:protein TIFY 7 isoform X2 [Sesamum indicum]|uniref:Protein TIFY n=1 Tax=Sesamum indicum TaxID=4182 RepID=A0A6I9SM81_SESIN|nr:protein TIFY 7 isoform X2 [Sesamum indicum]
MERDFLGLNSKNSFTAKEEYAGGGCEDSGFARSSGVPWPLSNKASALPQFMSMKSEQDEKQPPKNFGGAAMKQQFLGGNPLTGPHAILPSAAYVARTTEQWINCKPSSIPSQMTIFYGGTVNVFDDISPEKAQAIMFLAGNGCVPANVAQTKLQMQAPAPKLPAADRFLVNQSLSMSPGSGLPSPISVSSHPVDRSGVPAVNNDDVKVSKTVGMPTTLVNRIEPPRLISSRGSVAATAMISSAVPQSRKASLARFLEKRKERVMSAAPYNLSKNAADCGTPESTGFGFSSTSGVGSSSVSTNKETGSEP